MKPNTTVRFSYASGTPGSTTFIPPATSQVQQVAPVGYTTYTQVQTIPQVNRIVFSSLSELTTYPLGSLASYKAVLLQPTVRGRSIRAATTRSEHSKSTTSRTRNLTNSKAAATASRPQWPTRHSQNPNDSVDSCGIICK